MARHDPRTRPGVTSVGPSRPETIRNPLGIFQFNHLADGMLFGYSREEVASRQFAFVALPEKALLDLVHLTPGADSGDYLRELLLQNQAAIRMALTEVKRALTLDGYRIEINVRDEKTVSTA